MQHVSVKFFYPGGVSDGVIFDDMTDGEIFEMANTAATIEEGNGNGRIKKRDRASQMDGIARSKVRS